MKLKDKVLVVEDEQNISNFISTVLTANDFDVLMAQTGAEAISMITSHCPDLIILDLGLPDMDGMNILKEVRAWSNLPIIVVSARTHESDKVTALDFGADDYIEKPFGTSELLARIRTAIRHTRTPLDNGEIAQSGKFTVRDLTIDYDKHHVLVDGQDVHRKGTDLRLPHQADLGAQGQGRQPDPARQHGEYPPQDREKPRLARIYLHGDRRGLSNARKRSLMIEPLAAL